jgi:cobalamin biosynthesis protein CobT
MKGILNTTSAVAAAISGKTEVKVVVKGDQAYTNGKTIVIPDLGEIDEEKAVLVRGYLDHEAGHCRHTNMKVLKEIGNIELKNMFNIIEDIREEKLMGLEYPGSLKNLTGLNNHLIKKCEGMKLLPLFVEGYRQVAGQAIEAPDMTEELEAMFGDGIVDRLKRLKTTKDSLKLAEELLNILKDKKENPEHKESESESTEGSEGEGEGEGEKDSKDSSGSSPSKEASEILDELKDMTDKGKMIAEEISSIAAEELSSGAYRVFSTSGDKVTKVQEADSTKVFDDMLDSLGSLNSTRAKFSSIFLAKAASRWIGDREAGKINNRALAQVATGGRRVFKEKYRAVKINTAVSFLVDFSGSMNAWCHGGRRIDYAMKSVVLFLETLESIGVKTEVIGYTTDGYYPGYSASTPGAGNYGRIENLATYEFKRFDEVYNSSIKRRISFFDYLKKSQNCDPCSLRIAHERLMRRKEERKILIVLTDGMVENRGDCCAGHEEMKRLVKQIESVKKIEIIGIGMSSKHVEGIFSNNIVVLSGENLPKVLFAGIKDLLTK